MTLSQKQRFCTNGILDKQYGKQLAIVDVQDMNELLDCARKMDIVLATDALQKSKRSANNPDNTPNEPTRSPGKPAQQPQTGPPKTATGGSKTVTKDKDGRIFVKGSRLQCYNCGGADHYAKDCPLPDKRTPEEKARALAKKQASIKVNQATVNEENVSVSEETEVVSKSKKKRNKKKNKSE